MKEMFLDANAHLPMNHKALRAYTEFCQSTAGHGHPSSPSVAGRQAASALEDARGRICRALGAQKSSQIIFTSSCTQACEWGLEMLAQIDSVHNWNMYSSPLEHPAVKDVFETMAAEWSKKGPLFLPVAPNGVIQELDETADGKVCCIHVQNEIGTIQPLNKIRRRYMFSDLSQSVGKVSINLTKLKVDIAAFGSHKFGGPGGFGFLYLRDANWWISHGAGSRYFFDRSGTPDVAGAVATAVALEEALSTLDNRTMTMQAFQSTLENGLDKMGIEIIAKDAVRSPNTTFVHLPQKGIASLFKLGEQGIQVGLGSACGSMHAGNSPLMKALGRKGTSHDFLRISQWGEYGEEDAKYLLTQLQKALV